MNSVRYSKQHRTESRHSHPLDSYVDEERFPLMSIGTTRSLVHRFEERSECAFDPRKQFLECDRISTIRIRESIEVAAMTGVLRIAEPLLLSLEIGYPQSSAFLSGVGESGKPTLWSEMVRSRFAFGSRSCGSHDGSSRRWKLG